MKRLLSIQNIGIAILLGVIGVLIVTIDRIPSVHAKSTSNAVARLVAPNIVFVMMDDLDYSVWKTAMDHDWLPHIKNELMPQATTFEQAMVTLSICCPSRSTYLTGQYPHNHGVLRNSGPAGGFKVFANDDNTIATWMQAGGYRTGLMGKYLNGYENTGGAYVPPGWSTWKGLIKLHQYDWAYVDNFNVVTQFGSAPEDYQTDVLANFADAFIRDPDPRPFFLTMTPTAPHLESDDDDGGDHIRPPPRYLGTPQVVMPDGLQASFNETDMSDKPVWMRNRSLSDVVEVTTVYNEKVQAIRAVDDMVGKIIKALKETGKWNTTLLVVTSDNGFQYGTHRRHLTKVDLYEESINVPMVIRAPGQLKARVTQEWATNNDWAPTILDFADVKARRVLDGRSLRPVVNGTGTTRGTVMVELPPDGRERGHQPFYMVKSKDPAVTLDPTGQAVLVYAETLASAAPHAITDIEFYDMRLDPIQNESIHASTAPQRLRQMANLKARLDALKACAGKACKTAEGLNRPVFGGGSSL